MNAITQALQEGGSGTHPLVFALVAATCIAIERAIWFRQSAFDATELLDFAEERVRARDVGAAVTQCTLFAVPVVRVILAGLMHLDRSAAEIASALEQAMLRETPRAERRVAWLATLAQLAGLLGLLGTITGMLVTPTHSHGHGGEGGPTIDPARKAELLACSTGEALRCTQLGLLVALVAASAYALFRHAARSREQELHAAAARVIALGDLHRALRDGPASPYR